MLIKIKIKFYQKIAYKMKDKVQNWRRYLQHIINKTWDSRIFKECLQNNMKK